jgi:hypothetical protein
VLQRLSWLLLQAAALLLQPCRCVKGQQHAWHVVEGVELGHHTIQRHHRALLHSTRVTK